MAKKIVGYIKLQIPAGKANPSPPVGPALGQRGINIMDFCKAFNAQTQSQEPGLLLPTVITAYADKSFSFIVKTPPDTFEAMTHHRAHTSHQKRPIVRAMAEINQCAGKQLSSEWIMIFQRMLNTAINTKV